MINDMKVSVVLPVLNEEKGLLSMLPAMPGVVDEVILADNGSDDNSINIGKKYGAKIVNAFPKGYGIALLAGIEAASGDIIVFMDADASCAVLEIPLLLESLEKNESEFVSGKRSFVNRGLFSILGNLFMRLLVRMLYRIELVDTQSGVCAFKKDIFERIRTESKGMSFSQEIKLLAYLDAHIRTSEVPISSLKRKGRMKYRILADSFDNLRNFFKFYFAVRKIFKNEIL